MKVKFDVQDPEMSDDEVVSEDEFAEEELESPEGLEDTPEDAIEDDEEQQFYTEPIYNELREAMEDTDFRLYLINNDIVIPGTLEDGEIQFLDIVGNEGEEEFVMKPAPETIKELLEFKTLYNITNSEIEIPDDLEVQEAPHEKIVEYILSLKVSDEDADDVEDDEHEIDSMEKEEEDEENENNEE